jgi:hypothetical protein
MNRLLAAFLALCALFVTPSIASADPTASAAPILSVGRGVSFYCAAATAETVCEPTYIVTGEYIDIWVTIDNHAAGGERCRLFVNGRGYTPWLYLDTTNDFAKIGENVPGNTGFNIRCQRRHGSGDAGIGGYLGATYA